MKDRATVFAAFVAIVALGGCASNPSDEGESSSGSSASAAESAPKTQATGQSARFIPDYSKLEQDPDDENRLSWVNLDMTRSDYTGIIVAPVVFHLDPKLAKDGVRPNAETMNQIFDYFHEAMVREFGRFFEVTETPGDGVMRYQAAITGLDTKTDTGDSPANYIPVVFVARAASGANDVEARIFMEAFAKDSVTGELLAEVVQTGEGGVVGESREVTIGSVRPVLDAWAKKAAVAARNAVEKAQMRSGG